MSTFRKAPSDCYDQHSARDADSPAPYATTTLVSAGSAGHTPNGRRPSYRSNPHPHAAFFNHEQYQQQQLGNRSAYSDTYFNPTGHRINITENKLVNISGLTDAGYGSASTSTSTNTNAGSNISATTNNSATYRTSCSMPQTPLGTIRRNRLKLGRAKLRTSFGDSDGNLAGCEGDSQQEQLYVKVGEVNPTAAVVLAAAASSSDVYMNWGGGVQQMHDMKHKHFYEPQPKHQAKQHQQQLPSIYHRPDVIAQPLVATAAMPPAANKSTLSAAKSDKDMIYGPAAVAAAARSLIGSYRSGASNRFDDV